MIASTEVVQSLRNADDAVVSQSPHRPGSATKAECHAEGIACPETDDELEFAL
jgi:hypothetical protein